MRTLESLIKKYGGWDKAKELIKSNDYKKIQDTYLSTALKTDIRYNGSHFDKIPEENYVRELFETLVDLVINMYYEERAMKTDPEKITLSSYPLCFIVAFCINMSLHECTNKHVDKYKKWLEEAIETYRNKGFPEINSQLSFSRIMLHHPDSNIGFNWEKSPEKRTFWNDICSRIRYDRIPYQDDYDDFIKAHPECKKEIKEFYKR